MKVLINKGEGYLYLKLKAYIIEFTLTNID